MSNQPRPLRNVPSYYARIACIRGRRLYYDVAVAYTQQEAERLFDEAEAGWPDAYDPFTSHVALESELVKAAQTAGLDTRDRMRFSAAASARQSLRIYRPAVITMGWLPSKRAMEVAA